MKLIRLFSTVLLSALFAIVMTALTFTTPLGAILYYPSLLFLIEPWTVGKGEQGMGVAIYFVLLVYWLYGLLISKWWHTKQAKH